MRLRTKLVLSAIVGSASLAAAVPAQAQNYPPQRGQYDNRYDNRWDARGQANAIRVQIEQLEQRVRRTDNRDRISEREAAVLRRDVSNLRQQYRDYSRNGLTQREAQVLQSRIQQVRQRLTYERRDGDNRRW
jgi:hypothetical protein